MEGFEPFVKFLTRGRLSRARDVVRIVPLHVTFKVVKVAEP